MKKIMLLLSLLCVMSFAGSRLDDSLALMAIRDANPTTLGMLWHDGLMLDHLEGVVLSGTHVDPNSRVIELDLEAKNITQIPSTIGNLDALLKLNLSQNPIEALPNEFGNLHILLELRVEYCNLKSLPESFGNLSNLSVFYANYNQLTQLPSSFKKLVNIATLDVRNNGITALPDFTNMTELKELYVSHNALRTIPASIGNCTKLTTIEANNAKIESIPNELWSMNSLSYLALAYNDIKTLPTSVKNLSNLIRLDLGNNYIDTLPPEISYCTKLAHLFLSYNSLQSLPSTLSTMNLATLDVSVNFLTMGNLEFAEKEVDKVYLGGQGTLPTYVSTDSTFLFIIPGGSANDIQWLENEVPIKNAHSDTLKVTQADLAHNTYYARITSDIVEDIVLYSSKHITPNFSSNGQGDNSIAGPVAHIEAKVIQNKLIALSLPQSTTVSVRIFNARGQEISSMTNRVMPVGETLIPMNGINASGVYIMQIVSPLGVIHQKFTVQ